MAAEKDRDTKEVAGNLADRATRRPKRVPLNRQQILTVPESMKEPGYHYRFINDVGERILKAEQAGYEVVKGKVPVGDSRVGNSEGIGSAVTKHVGNATKAVLMRIKEEWYKEDQAEKIANIKAHEEQITTVNTNDGQYGNIKVEQSR
jgi:hypothetical protein